MTTAYVLKVYPRFSETFIVTELLAREAAGEQLRIYATRPTTDTRFHPEIAKVQAPVVFLSHPAEIPTGFDALLSARKVMPNSFERLETLLPVIERSDRRDFAQAVELAARLQSDGVTHLHAHFATAAARVACIAAGLAGITWSLTTHAKDIFHESVDRILLSELLNRASRVIAISQYNYDFLDEHISGISDRLELVRNGLELDRFAYQDPATVQGPLKVCAVGRMVEKKGFDVLLRAIGLARAAGVPVVARIAGDGERKEDLLKLADELGVSDLVSFIGARSQSEVVELLDWADVLAAPCVVGADGNADGLPTVLLEAMAKGVPVISTRVTGIPEVVKGDAASPETGILLEPGDVQSLADALHVIAELGFPRATVARAARKMVEREYNAANQAIKVREATR